MSRGDETLPFKDCVYTRFHVPIETLVCGCAPNYKSKYARPKGIRERATIEARPTFLLLRRQHMWLHPTDNCANEAI